MLIAETVLKRLAAGKATAKEQQTIAETYLHLREVARREEEARHEARQRKEELAKELDDGCDFTLADLPEYRPEDEDENVLLRGRVLERGGSLFVVSTSGTGKSIMATQWPLCLAEGLPFAGIRPTRKLNTWIFQAEDSKTRLVIDRDDVTAELEETFAEVDWRQTWRKVRFIRFPGKTGADFIAEIGRAHV